MFKTLVHKALNREGINKAVTAQLVPATLLEMWKSGATTGVVNSCHVISWWITIPQVMVKSSVQLTKIMKETGNRAFELAAEVTIYSQKLVNILVEKTS